jgi:hypothetical protein
MDKPYFGEVYIELLHRVNDAFIEEHAAEPEKLLQMV